MVKIATWNVNSVNKRLPNLLEWLDAAAPDVALLQELKCVEEKFPRLEIEAAGYQVAVTSQKSYNGVAMLSRQPIEKAQIGLPGDDSDEQARYVEGTTFGIRLAALYLPNGNPVSSEKYQYKLRWMARLRQHAADLLLSEVPVVLGGDYNVIPADDDVYDAIRFQDDALGRPETRREFQALLNLGYTEAWGCLHKERHVYSYWDYFGQAFDHNNGLRIDHLLLSPQAADRLVRCEIDKEPRGKESPSDHTPVWCELSEP
jgi:exodeoxyribonuclease-3